MSDNIKQDRIERVKAFCSWVYKSIKDFNTPNVKYAIELIEGLHSEAEFNSAALDSFASLEKALLNGAENWKHYSFSGCSLCYNSQIRERLNVDVTDGEKLLKLQSYALNSASIIIREFRTIWLLL